jgi:hypothetical protein
MAVPAFNIYQGETPDFKPHPRLFFRYVEKSALTTRTTSSESWKAKWDATIKPRADSLKGFSDMQLVAGDYCHQRLLILSFTGFILETGRPAAGYKDVAIRAAKYLCGLDDAVQPTNKRFRLLALAAVFDICFDDMTTAELNLLAGEITQQIDRQTKRDDEQMDGWSENDQIAAFAGALAIHGYSTFAAGAATRFQDSMNFFYGSVPNQGRIEMSRYMCADGGIEKGGWYEYLDWWGMLWILWFVGKATDIDTWTAEASWASKAYEWLLWGFRGGTYRDFEPMGDTAKQTNPVFHSFQRWAFGILATKYPNTSSKQGGQQLRWFYDLFDTFDTPAGDNLIHDLIFLDKANVTATAPSAASTPASTRRMFSPPGVFYYRQIGRGSGDNAWDPDKCVTIRISARKYYYLGHPHLDAGSVRMDFKGDPLLLAPAGAYDDFGGAHHYNAYQRSWLQSLSPIVIDPAAQYLRYSSTICVNDGGQQFRKYPGFAPPSVESDPNYVYAMQHDAGGLAWIRAESFEKLLDVSAGVFLKANIREAYKQVYTDPHRCSILETKFLVIEPTSGNGLTYPALLVYVRMKKRDPSWVTQIPFHFAAAPTTTAWGWHVLGSLGVGKLWVDVRNIAGYTANVVAPGTPADSNGYGPNQFKPSGLGASWPPAQAMSSRYTPDLKTHSVFLEKNGHTEEEHYVFLLMQSAAGDSEPVSGRAWVTDAAQPNYYGITMGSETHLIHRTQDLAILPGGAPDTTAPANVTGMTATARDKAIVAAWTDPADSDLDSVVIEIRTSAT